MAEKGKLIPVLGVSNDIPMLRSFVREFKEHGYGIVHAVDPETVETAFDKFNPQIVLLDEEVEGHFPEDFEDQKVIAILRERSTPDHRADVMESGVENYVIKPVVPSHLRWIVQRGDTVRKLDVEKKGAIQFGGFTLDLDARVGIFKGQRIDFTKLEFDLFEILLRNGDEATARQAIQNLFDSKNRISRVSEENTYIGGLRKKLEAHEVPLEIVTLRNFGWKLMDNDNSSDGDK